jgi:hypothetical protein
MIKWSRIAIASGQACNAILRDVEIDQLKQQINELKTLMKSIRDYQEYVKTGRLYTIEQFKSELRREHKLWPCVHA